jgi:hypothetical protein
MRRREERRRRRRKVHPAAEAAEKIREIGTSCDQGCRLEINI